eukprot:Nitzschia sp. Nitz4//scaffold147_size54853//5650//9283//NITZ4_006608-RA/size54853-processed-gene-0.8-mRNA-1//1//CDS//3329536666//5362//frame0
MSFLLRNRSSNGNSRPTTLGLRNDDRIIPRPRVNRTVATPHEASKTGIQSGNQVLLQRESLPIVSPQTTMKKQEKRAQGVISMSEVLADLRILEQQQREAQQKLEQVRLTKTRRIHQQTALQSKLEELKFTNGTLRQQLSQSREVLSTGTRTLGGRKLDTDTSGDEIRKFEKTLKRGLLAAHLNGACRRKIESISIEVENKLAALRKVKQETSSRLESMKQTMEGLICTENDLRASIQAAKIEAQKHTQERVELAVQHSEAKKDLLAAQTTEESTRARSSALAALIEDEVKASEDHKSQMTSEIANAERKIQANSKNLEILRSDLDHVTEQLEVADTEYSKIQQDSDVMDGLKNEDAIVKSLQVIQEKESEMVADTEKLNLEIKSIEEKLQLNQASISSNNEMTKSLDHDAVQRTEAESGKAADIEKFQEEIQTERTAVSRLKESVDDLRSSGTSTSQMHDTQLRDCEAEIEEGTVSIGTTRQKIEETKSALAEAASQLQGGKDVQTKQFEEMEQMRAKAEAQLQDTREHTVAMIEAGENHLNEELLGIRDCCAKTLHDLDKEKTIFVERYPTLQQVVESFVYDESVDDLVQEEIALEGVQDFINQVQQDIEAFNARRALEKVAARLKAEKAAAEVKRKEEGRRKNKERIDENVRLQGDNEPRNASSKRKGPSNKAKPASFYFPQCQGEGDNDDESPAHPKRLLPSFINAEERNKRTPKEGDLTQSSDKRVHWHKGINDEDITSVKDIGTTNRPPKHYGTSRRGLSAITPRHRTNTSPNENTRELEKLTLKDTTRTKNRRSSFATFEEAIASQPDFFLQDTSSSRPLPPSEERDDSTSVRKKGSQKSRIRKKETPTPTENPNKFSHFFQKEMPQTSKSRRSSESRGIRKDPENNGISSRKSDVVSSQPNVTTGELKKRSAVSLTSSLGPNKKTSGETQEPGSKQKVRADQATKYRDDKTHPDLIKGHDTPRGGGNKSRVNVKDASLLHDSRGVGVSSKRSKSSATKAAAHPFSTVEKLLVGETSDERLGSSSIKKKKFEDAEKRSRTSQAAKTSNITKRHRSHLKANESARVSNDESKGRYDAKKRKLSQSVGTLTQASGNPSMTSLDATGKDIGQHTNHHNELGLIML